jgi:predicted HD phosphohydrolase
VTIGEHMRQAGALAAAAAVTEPVRLHVAAKRCLCAAEPGYSGLLSAESVRTLALQGGPMTPTRPPRSRRCPMPATP